MNVKCATCKKVVEWTKTDYRPFCSERCKMVDLGTWANKEYIMPVEDVFDLDDID